MIKVYLAVKPLAKWVWQLLVAIIFSGGLVLPGLATQAAAPSVAQRGDGLDRSLLSVNNCGNGDKGDTHFTLAATGDTFPHKNIQDEAEVKGYDYLFEKVQPFLKAADLAYTNFDGAMLEGSPLTGYPLFNFSPKLATALKKAGIGLVSTANNHIMDRTPRGLDATLAVLQQAGIAQHGTVSSTATNQPRPIYLPLQLSRDGVSIKVAFLSFSWGTNGNPDPYDQVNLLWATNNYGSQGNLRQAVLEAIAKARSEADFVVVAAHWGYEYEFYPAAAQIEGAAKMAAAGADVILGAQSHTLQPVDLLENNGRKTLVIYSLANFIAAQSFNQATKFSDTSVIFYVGLTRHSNGTVGVSGYQYLPTIMTDNDTRPAPLPAEGFGSVMEHVRLEMRDFKGLRQLNPAPAVLDKRVEVCPTYTFPKEAPDQKIGGDFAQYFATLGSGEIAHPLAESVAMLGYPISGPVQEPSGDCQRITSVLYTERARLEWQPEAAWPFRVVGTQLGTQVYQKKYKLKEVSRRQDIEGEAISNPRFKAFYQSYGGLSMFGYPISPELTEIEASNGKKKTVQYFERARFELVEGAAESANPLYKVQLGALGREYSGIEGQCVQTATGGVVGNWLKQESKIASQQNSSQADKPAILLAGALNGKNWQNRLMVLMLGFGTISLEIFQHYHRRKRKYRTAAEIKP